MQTEFVRLEIPLPEELSQLQAIICQALAAHGEPLRWAITQVKSPEQLVIVEGIVTRGKHQQGCK